MDFETTMCQKSIQNIQTNFQNSSNNQVIYNAVSAK